MENADFANTVPHYTSIQEAAKLLDVHTDTIRRSIYAGKLPHVRLGRVIRIPIEALSLDALASTGRAR